MNMLIVMSEMTPLRTLGNKKPSRACARAICDLYRFGGQRNVELAGLVLGSLHGLGRDRPDIALDLFLSDVAQRSQSRTRQDQQAKRQVRHRSLVKRGIEGRNLFPMQRRDVFGFVPLLPE